MVSELVRIGRQGLRGVAFFGLVVVAHAAGAADNTAADNTAADNTAADNTAAGDTVANNPVPQNWPHWRGPLGNGFAQGADPPVEWSEQENIRWKTPLPGVGHSTPVIWGDRIFVTCALPYGDRLEAQPETAPDAHDNSPVTYRHQFIVAAIARRDGAILWQRTVHTALPHEGGHVSGSLASGSPVVDGEHLLAYFGSYGFYCLDHDGEMIWEKQLGRLNTKHAHGEGSSPVLHGDTVVVNRDHRGQSVVIAFDKATGEQRWKVDRDEMTSWASPIAVEHKGRVQVVVSGTKRVRSYDLETGETVWECGGLSANVVASPVAGDGMVFAASSYESTALFAVRLAGAKGDVTGTDQVAWSRVRGTPYVPSPLLYGDSLYFLRHYQGILTRVEAATGEEPTGPFRLGVLRNIYASPIGAAGRIYITDRDGATLVFSHGDIPRPLAVNRLDDTFSASAAAVDGELYLRGEKSLYCIADE